MTRERRERREHDNRPVTGDEGVYTIEIKLTEWALLALRRQGRLVLDAPRPKHARELTRRVTVDDEEVALAFWMGLSTRAAADVYGVSKSVFARRWSQEYGPWAHIPRGSRWAVMGPAWEQGPDARIAAMNELMQRFPRPH